MATEIKLPEIGEGVTEGELVDWLVKVGDSIEVDQPIVELMTDKATVEVPSSFSGVVKELKFNSGDIVEVGQAMVLLDDSSVVAKSSTVRDESVPKVSASKGKLAGKVTDVKLPEIGEGVTEGEMVDWLVKVGDSVEVDQPVAEVMTDKATVEVPTPFSGIVKELKLNTGDMIEVGQTMLLIEFSEGASVAPVLEKKSSAPVVKPSVGIEPPVADSKVLATPSTRRLAREERIDINQLQGTGLAGRITREDVFAVKKMGGNMSSLSQSKVIPRSSYRGPEGAIEERVALKGVRKKIAENMQMCKAVIPHFTLCDEADVTDLVKLRGQVKEQAAEYGAKVTYLPFVIKALISTIREFPMFNASIDDEAQEIVYKNYYNIGFAADTPNGLMVPVIKDADRKTIVEISKEIVDLATRAREGKLKVEEMRGATITVTNIGSVGGLSATPIINHPEVAILGMYKIVDRPVIIDGELDSAKMMNFTVTADHRLIDGAVAANFLKAFFRRIENPGNLMLDMI